MVSALGKEDVVKKMPADGSKELYRKTIGQKESFGKGCFRTKAIVI
jgi:hypothetical protein